MQKSNFLLKKQGSQWIGKQTSELSKRTLIVYHERRRNESRERKLDEFPDK